jgi:hypothetical protein
VVGWFRFKRRLVVIGGVLLKDIQSSKQFFGSSQDFAAFCILISAAKSRLIKSAPALHANPSIETMKEFKLVCPF